MRIAQVAPLVESVPPHLYGGAERVISYLTEELVDLGHRVTLFASGDSHTRASLYACSRRALRIGADGDASERAHAAMIAEVYARRHEFDIIHFHVGDFHLREPRLLRHTHLVTVHGRLDRPENQALYGAAGMRLSAVSEAQRRSLPGANWLGTVHHGMPDGLYRPHLERGSYLALLGRIAPDAGIDRAIEIARRAGMPLRIAAKVEREDYPYYLSIRHLLREPFVDFVGEVSQAEKSALLGGAYALLFPADRAEPFGLAMVEAMASGTPVVAWRSGSVPELVDPSLTGFVVNSVEGAVGALARVAQLDRRMIARVAAQRFAARRMARDYLRLYARSIALDLTLPAFERARSGVGASAEPALAAYAEPAE